MCTLGPIYCSPPPVRVTLLYSYLVHEVEIIPTSNKRSLVPKDPILRNERSRIYGESNQNKTVVVNGTAT